MAQVPWLLVATVVGAACAFLLGTWLLPDQPERLLGGLCSVLDVRVAAILGQLRALRCGPLDRSRRAHVLA